MAQTSSVLGVAAFAGFAVGLRLADLGPPEAGKAADCYGAALIDSVLASGVTPGHNIIYIIYGINSSSEIDRYAVRADPIVRGNTGQYSFYTDEWGVVRSSATGIATSASGSVE